MKPRILIVDDEKEFVDTLAQRLTIRGYDVTTAFSGKEAIETVRGYNFDVVILDVLMPGMDGVGTQKMLHQIQPFLQCIVLTGHGSIDSALESGQQDAFRYLLKPVDYDGLLSSIKEAHEKKMKIVNEKFQEQVEEIYRSGLGAKGIKKAINELRKKYGIE